MILEKIFIALVAMLVGVAITLLLIEARDRRIESKVEECINAGNRPISCVEAVLQTHE